MAGSGLAALARECPSSGSMILRTRASDLGLPMTSWP
jgi:hypothetical protein